MYEAKRAAFFFVIAMGLMFVLENINNYELIAGLLALIGLVCIIISIYNAFLAMMEFLAYLWEKGILGVIFGEVIDMILGVVFVGILRKIGIGGVIGQVLEGTVTSMFGRTDMNIVKILGEFVYGGSFWLALGGVLGLFVGRIIRSNLWGK